jgi:alpha-aminoadipate/glutamate carrier protein LysW
MTYCAECDTKLDIDEDEIEEGDIISCAECGTDFEIVTISPLELKPVEAEGYEEEEEEEAEDGDYS